jgi:hypothetical protein
MFSIAMPALICSSSAVRCGVEPWPGLMTLSLFLSALAMAIRSATVLIGDEGGTRITFGEEPSSVIGRKSLKAS